MSKLFVNSRHVHQSVYSLHLLLGKSLAVLSLAWNRDVTDPPEIRSHRMRIHRISCLRIRICRIDSSHRVIRQQDCLSVEGRSPRPGYTDDLSFPVTLTLIQCHWYMNLAWRSICVPEMNFVFQGFQKLEHHSRIDLCDQKHCHAAFGDDNV